MKIRLFAGVMLLTLLSLLGLAVTAPTAAHAATVTNATAVPITGSATNALGQLVNFNGSFNLQQIVRQNGQLAAVGTLTGTLTNTVTHATQTVNQLVTIPLQAAGSCTILHLTLGPL